ncbi:uncharacterized protein B0H18DRAFT_1112597 [Fomitopsis serialis]|uniref:uncharacterized protein n=1 Tax=Fomitopsis serialis TaxID=139415 RepID=UPI0020081970|nr:uncharacterized protein B0H18DRAFT_1112597 [Neoantrodia serialis]KAH9938440.1 hypothetical protein B0H18DRAFT_1112597 [Neoantrodia serialis]
MHIWVATLDETIPDAWKEVYERGLRLVDPATRDRLNKFYHKRDSFRGLVGCLLPRMLLKERGVPLDEMAFGRTQSGKPFIASVTSSYSLTLFADGGVVAMAWSSAEDLQGPPAYRLGIDVMKVQLPERETFANFLDAFSDQLTPLEHRSLLPSASEPSLPESEALYRFYLIWTLKEAYTKALGLGLGFEFKRIEYDIHGETVRIDGALTREWKFVRFEIPHCLRSGREDTYVGVAALSHREQARQDEDCRVEWRDPGAWLDCHDAVEFVERALHELA